MKLRNKKTGEIVKVNNLNAFVHTDEETKIYHSLAELCEEWEDYEEPKEFWYIYAGKPQRADCGDILEEDFRAIGNHFETREETEKAIEKLKAWKRLEEKGFEFRGYEIQNEYLVVKTNFHRPLIGEELDLTLNAADSVNADLDLLLGSEE